MIRHKRGESSVRTVTVVIVLVLLSSGVVSGLYTSKPLVVGGAILGIVVFVGWRLYQRSSEEAGRSDDEKSVWNAIPRRQYTGRHVESGGLTRDEQEHALEEVQREAEEIEDLNK